MKHLFIAYKKLIMLFYMLLFYAFAKAQVCDASNSNNATGLNQTVSLSQTSNDVWALDNCVDFRVWVNQYGIKWGFSSCGNSGTGIISLSGTDDIYTPDIAIIWDASVDNGGVYYALAVYYNSNDRYYYYHAYYIDAYGDLQSYAAAVPLFYCYDPPLVGNGIRIDANKTGDFVIVLDDLDDHYIKTIAGKLNPGIGPILAVDAAIPPNLLILNLPPTGPATPPNDPDLETMPDVAIEETATEGEGRVYFTYLSTDFLTLVVSYQDFNDVYTDNMTAANTDWKKNANMGGQFYRPRIACPYPVSNDFNVVWQAFDGTNMAILGLTYHSGTDYDHNYTDNSEAEFVSNSISVDQNFYQQDPSISYGFNDEDGNVAQLVWDGGHWSGSPPDGTSGVSTILALSLDESGSVAPNCSSGPPCFKIVPNGGITPVNPSVSGRHAPYNQKMNVCWWDDEIPNDVYPGEVFNKDFQWCDDHYRNSFAKNSGVTIIKNIKDALPQDLLYPNPSNGVVKFNLALLANNKNYQMAIRDITGKRIASFSGHSADVEQAGEKAIGLLKAGMYILTVYDNNNIVVTKKITRL